MSSPKSSTPVPSGRLATDDERRLFELEMQGVRPLAQGSKRAVPDWDTVPEPSPPQTRPHPGPPGLRVEASGDRVSGTAYGVAHDLLRDLAAGRMPAEAELNLHHAPADSAVQRTRRFVDLSQQQGRRCVLVIHGRGQHSGPSGPVLLSVLLDALNAKPLCHQVLAVTTAPPQYGGSGAMLLYLRKKADQK